MTLFERSAFCFFVSCDLFYDATNFTLWGGAGFESCGLDPVYSNVYWLFCIASIMHALLNVYVAFVPDSKLLSKINSSE